MGKSNTRIEKQNKEVWSNQLNFCSSLIIYTKQKTRIMIPIKGMVYKLPTVQLTNANLLTYKIVSKLVFNPAQILRRSR